MQVTCVLDDRTIDLEHTFANQHVEIQSQEIVTQPRQYVMTFDFCKNLEIQAYSRLKIKKIDMSLDHEQSLEFKLNPEHIEHIDVEFELMSDNPEWNHREYPNYAENRQVFDREIESRLLKLIELMMIDHAIIKIKK